MSKFSNHMNFELGLSLTNQQTHMHMSRRLVVSYHLTFYALLFFFKVVQKFSTGFAIFFMTLSNLITDKCRYTPSFHNLPKYLA